MLLENVQILCSVYWAQGIVAPYRLSHKNHPVCVFARTSCLNFEWIIEHGKGLCAEYTARYGRVHKSEAVLKWCDDNSHNLVFPQYEMTPFALAMPEQYRSECAVTSYRNYFKGEKKHLYQWKQNRPSWA